MTLRSAPTSAASASMNSSRSWIWGPPGPPIAVATATLPVARSTPPARSMKATKKRRIAQLSAWNCVSTPFLADSSLARLEFGGSDVLTEPLIQRLRLVEELDYSVFGAPRLQPPRRFPLPPCDEALVSEKLDARVVLRITPWGGL